MTEYETTKRYKTRFRGRKKKSVTRKRQDFEIYRQEISGKYYWNTTYLNAHFYKKKL